MKIFNGIEVVIGQHHVAGDGSRADRAEPESVVPALLRLLDDRPASGRYRAADLLAAGARA